MLVYSDLTEFVKFVYFDFGKLQEGEKVCWNKISSLEKFIFVELSAKQIM